MGQKKRYTRDSSRVKINENSSVTKRSILSQLSAIYDPLGVISPTIVKGKRIYREACHEKTGWNSEVSGQMAANTVKNSVKAVAHYFRERVGGHASWWLRIGSVIPRIVENFRFQPSEEDC